MSGEAGAGAYLEPAADGLAALLGAGEHAAGEFRCSECGYGVTVHRALPRCPMCGGSAWEGISWSPLTRVAAASLQ